MGVARELEEEEEEGSVGGSGFREAGGGRSRSPDGPEGMTGFEAGAEAGVVEEEEEEDALGPGLAGRPFRVEEDCVDKGRNQSNEDEHWKEPSERLTDSSLRLLPPLLDLLSFSLSS